MPLKDPTNILLRPSLSVSRFVDVDFEALAAQGIVNYCLDVDNTLVPQFSTELAPGVFKVLEHARARGHVHHVCLISNVIWGAHKVRRLARIAELLGIPDYYPAMFFDKKPGTRPFLWALERMNARPGNTGVIGDQIFSDVLGGNRLGLYTILVRPLGGDHWTTALSGRRLREKRLRRLLSLD